jgi:RNA polymerase sigma factor (TIGR02999 family)
LTGPDTPPKRTIDMASNADSRGKPADELFQAVYTELRRLAVGQLAEERPDHTLSPTDLVHEAYLGLAPRTEGWGGRTHFLCAAAQAMRHILVSHARSKGRLKRGGGWHRVDLDEAIPVAATANGEMIDLSDALSDLAAEDPDTAAVVELRYFAGAGWPEIAEATGQPVADVKELWAYAKAWLYDRLAEPAEG